MSTDAVTAAMDRVSTVQSDNEAFLETMDSDSATDQMQNLQNQLKMTEAVNFATNLMMTIHQQIMAAINKLGQAGQ